MKPNLELRKYQDFRTQFEMGGFGTQRFGQAFYNYFELHKMSDQLYLQNLYELDREIARYLIRELFDFT